MKILVTGGVRSGKSWHAESLLAAAPSVSYVAPGPTAAEEPDPDWVARLAAHRRRRPGTWTTVETRDLASALRLGGPVLVDCLGTWLTSMIDSHVMWEATSDDVTGLVDRLLDGVVGALDERDDAILVTNEVGWGVVPAHRSGRLFRDLLGLVNRRVATACDEVHLVVAGQVLRL
ncbi:MAG: bifunctional adenosylcobinamide kinase/adenosylcobinamide-phosphate guanylyltransferase [Nocardioides sp.]|uniref:bifunctional adenosylcobinamide kinase/adenosylcobinamide-phosphate guanylyltransferase n=1 Tax=Nocardioides sp. TaxID=35761 RepID=UPI00260EFC84|nr:bifunctional adenosylcobinamide kinase/adenosylcobinamide-phosphate guanylyltransferase [Nocardioides sp.]MCW2833720.1 bifunctional adenosylcobinamide kinase/adenosylcobinamide-phosphate guanylyltransferase [Nocardioides sp.]